LQGRVSETTGLFFHFDFAALDEVGYPHCPPCENRRFVSPVTQEMEDDALEIRSIFRTGVCRMQSISPVPVSWTSDRSCRW